MFIRTPTQAPLANSNARFALFVRSDRGTRVLEIGGRTVTALILLSALLMAWYLFATLYLVFRDDVVMSMMNGQRQTHYAYEDRILELRSRIDKITARQLVNQDSIEDRVASLVARQAEIEARQVLVADLGDRAERAGLTASTRMAQPERSETISGSIALPFTDSMTRADSMIRAKPRPLPVEALSVTAPLAPPVKGFEPAKIRGPMDGIVTEVERRTIKMEKAQVETLRTIGAAAGGEIEKSRKLVAAIGLDPARFGKTAFGPAPIRRLAPLDELMLRDVSADTTVGTAMGGPLLPPASVKTPEYKAPEYFDNAIGQTEGAIEGALKARAILKAIPVGRPLGERYDLSSGFGTRLDPFTRSPALHSGLDFRAPSGTPVRAVAAGRIIEAGPNGGYGRMVEIDHGYGITTRYAHMSSIAVNEGGQIEKGAVIGYVGSTGRSTGPHLHYEVLIDDDATDPMRFVRAAKLVEKN